MKNNRYEYDPILNRDGNCVNGAAPADDLALEVYESLNANAVDIATLGAGETGYDMPVVAFNDALRAMLAEEFERYKACWDRGECTLPWEVEKVLPANQVKKYGSATESRLYWSQKALGSCMGHSDAFAGASATLSRIALGSNLIYCPINPVVTWAITKGGSLRGGQTVSLMAEGANELGHYPEYLVGKNNLAMPDGYATYKEDALDHQWGIAFLPGRTKSDLAEDIFQCCKAGFGVAFANSTAVSGATTDANGIKIAVIRGTWAHATSFTQYRKINGTEYVFWVNSHGPIYGSSDEGEPADGCWMTRSQIEIMCSSAFAYGQPYLVIPESTWVKDDNLISTLTVPRPKNFIYKGW